VRPSVQKEGNMQRQSIATTLKHLQENLEDAKNSNGKPCRIYLAYKDHLLSSGIYELESLATGAQSDYKENIHVLLIQYRQESQNSFNI
jgi:hypothetical protein